MSATRISEAIMSNGTRSARADFDALDWYSRWCIFMGGTAFTTYEDHGDAYCAELRRLVAEWAAQESTRSP